MEKVKLQAWVTEKLNARVEKFVKKQTRNNPKFTRADLVRMAVLKYLQEN